MKVAVAVALATIWGVIIGLGVYRWDVSHDYSDPRFTMIFQVPCPGGTCSANAMCSDGHLVWPARQAEPPHSGEVCYSEDRPKIIKDLLPDRG